MIRCLLPFLALVLLAGCVTDERLAQVESVAAKAQQIADRAADGLAAADKAVAMAEKALATARALAEATGSEQARGAVAAADRALEQAKEALPIAQAAAETTRQAAITAHETVEQARAAKAAGASGIEVILGLVGTFGGGAIAAAIPLIRAIGRWRTATRLASSHADRMEQAETDVDVAAAKQKSGLEQAAAGVHTLIAQVRGKA